MLRYDFSIWDMKTSPPPPPMDPILGVASSVGINRKACDDILHSISSPLHCISYASCVIS